MDRKPFLLRIDPKLWAELEAWAQDELRSVMARSNISFDKRYRNAKGTGSKAICTP